MFSRDLLFISQLIIYITSFCERECFFVTQKEVVVKFYVTLSISLEGLDKPKVVAVCTGPQQNTAASCKACGCRQGQHTDMCSTRCVARLGHLSSLRWVQTQTKMLQWELLPLPLSAPRKDSVSRITAVRDVSAHQLSLGMKSSWNPPFASTLPSPALFAPHNIYVLVGGPQPPIFWLCCEDEQKNRYLTKLNPATCCFHRRDWCLGGKGSPSIQKQLQQRRPHCTQRHIKDAIASTTQRAILQLTFQAFICPHLAGEVFAIATGKQNWDRRGR